MYQNNHPSATRRSGDEFLRRMLSSDLPSCPSHATIPIAPVSHRPDGAGGCGNTHTERPTVASISTEKGCGCGSARLDEPRVCMPPVMPAGCANGCNHPPVNPTMPALAMVYSPEQAWRCLYTPDQALEAGTLFDELNKPFEGRTIAHCTQRGCRA